MMRRVKLYMEKLNVIQDEDQLRDMSLKVEPVASTGKNATHELHVKRIAAYCHVHTIRQSWFKPSFMIF